MRVHESVKQILVAIPLLALPILAASAELPPELAADRLVLRAERQAREGEHPRRPGLAGRGAGAVRGARP